MPEVLKIQTAEVFEPLLQPKRYKGAFGGRGSGKSHFFAELAVERCVQIPRTRIVCAREVQKALRDSVKLLIEDKIKTLGVGKMFRVLSDRIETPGDGVIVFQGMQDHTAESIKSLEGFDIAYVEEAQTFTKRSLELLRPTIRNDSISGRPASELWFSWNPRDAKDPVDAFLRGPTPPENSAVVRSNYLNNPFFPDVLEEERIYDEINSRDRYAHIWLGEYEPAALGAIWDRITIHNTRVEEAPRMSRILVSVDPAVSSEELSNEHGVLCGGLGEDGDGYVLEDGSRQGTPHQWAERAVALHDKHDADAIVIEINQGGDMVRHTLKTIRPNIRIIEVRATKGKHVRAEPIAALYTLGKIHHVGTFPELEDQMCLMTASGYEGKGSPDRCDAMVWLMSELFPRMTRKVDKGGRPEKANSGYSPHNWRNHA
jgi:phage terminase large subunit-like protein